jgi:hypothetical protein
MPELGFQTLAKGEFITFWKRPLIFKEPVSLATMLLPLCWIVTITPASEATGQAPQNTSIAEMTFALMVHPPEMVHAVLQPACSLNPRVSRFNKKSRALT